jgi:Phosphotransferase enzyme family
LTRVVGVVPVPEVIDINTARARVTFAFVPGRHGQELMDEGHAARVLQAAGGILRRLQDQMPGLVHGDYGPQNLLLEPGSLEVVAVLDWEFSHDGTPVEDLAWAEWIVWMHHPDASGTCRPCSTGTNDGRRGGCVTPRCRTDARASERSASDGVTRSQSTCGAHVSS